MLITIQNITWNYSELSQYDEEHLGLSYVGIPDNMLKRFIKECAWDSDLKVPPHYYEEDLESMTGGHECYNADTQIVLMNWLNDKRRKYNLDYRGSDPYWVFHDSCHSKSDVYGYEMSPVNADLEHCRLFEGAEMAKHNGIYIKPKTVIEIEEIWDHRFGNQSQKFNGNEMVPYMSELGAEEYERLRQVD